MKTFIALLQNRGQFIQEVQEGKHLKSKVISLCLLAFVTVGIYGLIIGSSHCIAQALSSGIKLPILFLLTIVICAPTLFIFNGLFGSKRSALQTLIFLFTGVAIMGIVLVGFAPVTLFFIITTDSYQFFKLLNILFFSISGIIAVLFFNSIYGGSSDDPGEGAFARSVFLKLWFVLFALVGTQLGWTLRPFFGSPDMDFQIVRELNGNFYTDVFKSLGHIFGGR